MVLLQRFIPIFEPIPCNTVETRVEDPEYDYNAFTVSINGHTFKDCTSSNHYDLHIQQDREGIVYIKGANESYQAVGTSEIYDTILPEMATGQLTAVMNITVSLMEAMDFMATEQIDIVTEVDLIVEARFPVLGVAYSIKEKQTKVCGFGLNGITQEVGNAACAFSREDLIIPAVNSTEEVDTHMDMTPESYAEKRHFRNFSFGPSTVAWFVLGLAFLVCGVRTLMRNGKDNGEIRSKQAREVAV